MKKSCFICLLLVLSLFLSSCLTEEYVNDVTEGADTSAEESQMTASAEIKDEEIPYSGKYYIVENIEELRKLNVTAEQATVTVKGYYTANDGGGGTFFWNYVSNKDDNGGTVIKTENNEKGRFIRLYDENRVNVKWFGAKGTGKDNDTAAIQAAIDALPARGGTVSLPGGTYVITSELVIGNGDSAESWSSSMGVKLVGEGAGFGVSGDAIPTVIMAGKAMDSVISVNGRISGVSLIGLEINANRQAKNGVVLKSFCGAQVINVRISQFTAKGLAIIAGNAPTGNYNIYNRFENIEVVSNVDNTIGLYMDGDWSVSNDTWLTTFTNCAFDVRSSENSSAAYFKFVDSISFYSCSFKKEAKSSNGIVFDASENKDFPSGIGFYDCSVASAKAIEAENSKIRGEYFYGFKTRNGEEIPEHYMLFGITDEGKPFNMDNLSVEGGGSDGPNVPKKNNTFDTYMQADYVHINLAAEKSQVGVLFNAGNKVTKTSMYMPSYGDKFGDAHFKFYVWDTDYATTVKGEPVYTADFIDYDDNTWNEVVFDKPLDPGAYLMVITCTQKGDFGSGVWTQKAAKGIKTFYNGEEADFGLVGTIYLGD